MGSVGHWWNIEVNGILSHLDTGHKRIVDLKFGIDRLFERCYFEVDDDGVDQGDGDEGGSDDGGDGGGYDGGDRDYQPHNQGHRIMAII